MTRRWPAAAGWQRDWTDVLFHDFRSSDPDRQSISIQFRCFIFTFCTFTWPRVQSNAGGRRTRRSLVFMKMRLMVFMKTTGVHENGLSDLAAADFDEFSNFCSDYRSSCRFPFGDHMWHSDELLGCIDGFEILQLNGTESRIAIITTRMNKETVVCIVSWKAMPLSSKF